ncbi:ABC transporter permease [Nocardia sp. NPDC058658]|uniref:ABC transporter permease n=1 Tax=Nocardia sp. NPDC058658 TaxID=3346580 RepID=UPI0036487107
MTPLVRRIAQRIGANLLLLLLLSLVVYLGVDMLPGDPITGELGLTATPDQIAAVRAHLGLDRPILARYADWVAGVAHGDFGTSTSGRPVTDMLGDRVGNSIVLACLAIAIVVPLSLGLAVLAALHRDRATDRALSTTTLLLVSVPEFVVASGLVVIFAVNLRWLPAVSIIPAGSRLLDHPDALALPVLALASTGTAYAFRVIRSTAATELRASHVEFLRLSGATTTTVLRTAVVPAVLPVAVQCWLVTGVGLIGGAVLVEKVFSYPGIGELLVTSTQSGDLPVVQALVLILGAATLAVLTIADLAVRLLTPRLRTGTRG